MWGVECLDLATGRLIWRKAAADLIGIAGRVGTRLILETAHGLAARDLSSGEVLWHHSLSDRLDGLLCGDATGIIYVQRRPREKTSADAPGLPLAGLPLVRLDPADGHVLVTSLVDTPRDNLSQLGPLLSDGTRIWGFLGRRGETHRRELVELVPAGEGAAVP